MGEDTKIGGRQAVLSSYRRFLIDMHVPDWDGEFMVNMDPTELISRVAGAGATVITVPANNHAGLNFWPSSVGATHRGHRCGELLPRLLDAALAEGLSSVVYYCISYVDWFWHHYPSARVVDASGNARRLRVPSTGDAERFGVCCINSPEYRDFVFTQVDELADWYEPDGFNLDMTVWPGACFCEACKRRACSELGTDIPHVLDWGQQPWRAFADARRRWMAEFVEQLSGVVRRHRPGASLTHQSGGYVNDWGSGSSEMLSRSADWLSADLYQDRASLSVSLKLFESMSIHHPAELIHSWCAPTIFEHSATKTTSEILNVAAAAVANGTALSIIEAINPDGSTSADRYDRARPVFGLVAQLEPVLGGVRQADVAVYRSFQANFDPSEPATNLADYGFVGEPAYRGTSTVAHRRVATAVGEALLERHLLFSVITRLDLDHLSDWKLIVLPNVALIDEAERKALREYVGSGGSVYLSLVGATVGISSEDNALNFVRDSMDVEVLGRSQGGVTYMAPTGHGSSIFRPFSESRPFTVHSDQVLLRSSSEDVRVLARVGLPYSDPRGSRYASVLTDPMGRVTDYPALMDRQIGEGRVVVATGTMEAEKATEQQDVFGRLVRSLVASPTVEVSAPACIEVTCYSRPDLGATLLYFLNSQFSAPPVPVSGIRTGFAGDRRPKSVKVLPEERELSWEENEDGFGFELPHCETLAVVRIDW